MPRLNMNKMNMTSKLIINRKIAKEKEIEAESKKKLAKCVNDNVEFVSIFIQGLRIKIN